MNETEKNSNLFSEFNELSKQEWESLINEDLNIDDYKKRLAWKSDEGFVIQPFFVKDEIAQLPYPKCQPGKLPFTRGNSADADWKICEQIFDHKPGDINKQIRSVRNKGVDSFRIYAEPSADEGMLGGDLRGAQVHSQHDFNSLFEGIEPGDINFVFDTGIASPAYLAMFLNILDQKKANPDDVAACFSFDPFAWLSSRGREPHDENTMNRHIAEMASYKLFRTLNANGLFYQTAGATIVQEIGIILATGSEFLNRALNAGISADAVVSSFYATVSSDSQLFPGIAKLRALRTLWPKVVGAYDSEVSKNARLPVHSVTSSWNKSSLDAYNNMLRVTTETVAAALGGAELITTLPYDSHFKSPNDFSLRIARNVQHILKHESHLTKVADPAAGSYYIEQLTDTLCREGWEFFKMIEKQGGIVEAIKGRMLQHAIENAASGKMDTVRFQKKSLVGVNKYPDTDKETPVTNYRDEFTDSLKKSGDDFEIDGENLVENLKKAFSRGATLGDLLTSILDPAKQMYPPIVPIRLAGPFEKLRMEVKDFEAKYGSAPKVALLLAGDKKMSRARSSFSQNFLGCAGYQIDEYPAYDDLKAEAGKVKKEGVNAVVLCSSDADYESLVGPFCNIFSDEDTVMILAGYPGGKTKEYKKAGIDFFIHRKSDILDALSNLNRKLNL